MALRNSTTARPRRALALARPVALVIALALGTAACGADDDPAVTDPSTTLGGATSAPDDVATTSTAPARTDVEALRLDLVDESRGTPAAGDVPAEDVRRLPTDVYLPAGTGPFPLVVHAHGAAGSPEKFSELLRAWAEAGYVVAAPRFPRSSDTGPGTAGISDYVDQPGDVSFVIDEMLARYPADIDPERIGVSGLSLGGGTVYGLVWNPCCRDERIDAAIVMSSLRFPFEGEYATNEVPVLMMHGDADPVLPFADAEQSFADSAAPKWFVQLIGAGHAEAYEDQPSPHDAVVTAVTTAFWDGTLGGDDAALDRITTLGTVEGLASVSSQP